MHTDKLFSNIKIVPWGTEEFGEMKIRVIDNDISESWIEQSLSVCILF